MTCFSRTIKFFLGAMFNTNDINFLNYFYNTDNSDIHLFVNILFTLQLLIKHFFQINKLEIDGIQH